MSNDDNKTILIVDDEEMVAESYELYLRDKYETRVETNGGAALCELTPSDREIDLILLDRRMPGMSGDVVAEHVDEYELEYQVIMVSAVDPDLDIIDMPVDGYLSKPVSEEEVVEAVERTFLIADYRELLLKYNEAVEKHDLLVSDFSSDDAPAQLEQLRNRMQSLEQELHDLTDSLSDTNLGSVFDKKEI
jgi:DNA-binding response OmpR family regulator